MSDQPQNESPKLHVDADWKAQAQAEKQKLSEKAKEESGQSGQGPGGQQIPPADFKTLVSMMVSQALLYMGQIPEPSSGQRILHMDLARHNIDMLGLIEEKTKGNLEEEEEKLIKQAVSELRSSYVELSKQVAAHQAQQASQQGGQGGQDTGGSDSAGGGGIITP